MLNLRLSTGIFRTTLPGRLEDLDRLVNALLLEHFDPGVALRVEDWAASDCITSAEWFKSLHGSFPKVQMVASDLDLYLIEASLREGGAYIFEGGGGLLQYIRPPFVLDLSRPESSYLIVNRALRTRAVARLEQLRAQGSLDLASLNFRPGMEAIERGAIVFRRIPLVHPSAQALAQSDPAFRIERHSVFDVSSGQPQVVRTMNIFNTSYFDVARLTQGITAVWKSLASSGIWIVGRSIMEARPPGGKPPIHGSVMRKTGVGFEVLKRLDAKSEVEDLALSLRM